MSLKSYCEENNRLHILKEWDTEKNLPLDVHDILPNSFKVVWWKCQYGHSWKARVQSRCFGRGCPYCAGRRVIPGKNDMETVNPALKDEWDYARNHPLLPRDVKSQSNKKVWWKCRNGHGWQSSVYARVEKGLGCPYCSGQTPKRTRLIEL